MENRNVSDVFMHENTYLESQKSDFELHLCHINHKTCRRSSNLVLVSLVDTSTRTIHILWEKFVLKQINNFTWRLEVCLRNHFFLQKI